MNTSLSFHTLTGRKVPFPKLLKYQGAKLAAQILSRRFYTDYTEMTGKSIILVGPADTATKFYTGNQIDAFDLVVRVNSSLDLVDNLEGAIGNRTDVLYHNLKEYGERSTGVISLSALTRQQTRMIICPTPIDEKLSVIMKKKLYMLKASQKSPTLKVSRVCATPRSEYAALCTMLGGWWPTTGLAGIYSLLQSQAARVAVTGFTFYTTGYSSAYKQNFTTASDITDWTDQNVVHRTDLEKDVFCDIILKARAGGKVIDLDPILEGFVRSFNKRERQR